MRHAEHPSRAGEPPSTPVRLPGIRTGPILSGFLLVASIASAQMGPPGLPPAYPGQRPYPGSNPSPGIPIPGKGSKQSKKSSDSEPLPSFRGILKQMDSKTITVTMGDNRELEFKRTDKTKFYKNGEQLKSPDFKPGDQVSVEGQQDAAGYLTAVNVYWEKPASAAKSEDKDSGVMDTWAHEAEKPGPATDVKPSPAPRDPDDPGPPQLRRGKPADAAREHAPELPAQPPETAAVKPPTVEQPVQPAVKPPSSNPRPVREENDDDLPFGSRQQDPLIRKAANAALDFTETLPNYVCQEMVSRFQSETKPANWQPVDVVTAEVVYEKGKEDYRNITVGGKPVKKSMDEIGGAWSTGEFGSMLMSLFAPATGTEFHYRKDSRIAGVTAKEYAFDVARENSHWTVQIASQKYRPAYSGSIWIDQATARVMRIEMEAKGLPDEFATDHVESATDYEYVRLGGTQQFLLPVHAETLACQRGTNNCSRNVIDFRNYHKFEGQSTITFGDEKP